jgi:hypothetical protein
MVKKNKTFTFYNSERFSSGLLPLRYSIDERSLSPVVHLLLLVQLLLVAVVGIGETVHYVVGGRDLIVDVKPRSFRIQKHRIAVGYVLFVQIEIDILFRIDFDVL